MKAIVAIDAGNKLVKEAAKRLSTPNSQVPNVMIQQEEVTKNVNEVIAKYVDTSAINRNKLIDGSSVNRLNASNAIAKNSRPRKTVNRVRFNSYIHFFLLLKIMADILKFTETPLIDESIEEYEYHEYDPITGISLNNGVVISELAIAKIRIRIRIRIARRVHTS